MSRQPGVSTSYDKKKLQAVFTIVLSLVLIGSLAGISLFLVRPDYFLQKTDPTSLTNTPGTALRTSPTATPNSASTTPYPTIDLLTPTPLPSLTVEQNQIMLKRLDHLLEQIPPEAVAEIEQATQVTSPK